MSETSMVERGRDAILAKVPHGYGMAPNEAAGYARAVIEALGQPTEEMLDAARHLMMWLDSSRPTEAGLRQKCRWMGKTPPPECRDIDHVPPKALRTFWIWRAMISAALSPEAKTGEGRE